MWLYNGQVYGMFYKNYLSKRRYFFATFFEFCLPFVLSMIVAKAYSYTKSTIGRMSHEEKYIFGLREFNSSLWQADGACKLMYAPKTQQTATLINYMKVTLGRVFPENGSPCDFEGYESEEKILEQLQFRTLRNMSKTTFRDYLIIEDCSGITEEKGSLRYKIKSPDLVALTTWSNKKRGLDFNFARVFLPIQHIIEESYYKLRIHSVYVKLWSRSKGEAADTENITMEKIPRPAGTEESESIWFLRFFLLFGTLLSFVFMGDRICTEKNNGTREMLKMCGVDSFTYWLSNIVFNWIFVTLMHLMMVLIVVFPPDGPPSMWSRTNLTLIIMLFALYSLQVVLIAMLFTVFFSRSIVCDTFVLVYFFGTTYLYAYLEAATSKSVPLWIHKISCMSPMTGYLIATNMMLHHEIHKVDLNFHSWGNVAKEFNGMTFDVVLLLMFSSCFVYSIALLYFDAVWPWQPGVPRSPIFFLLPSFWCPRKNETAVDSGDNPGKGDRSYYEQEDPNKPVAIQCVNLTKIYRSWYSAGRKVAVENVNLKIYEGGITCLLGHNGAGKSTTMSMMTGMFTPTSGSVFVNGYDLNQNTALARENLSLCPQTDPLCDHYTVREHLYLYALVKNTPWEDLKEEVNSTLEQTSMKIHSNKLPSELSGGMKRKLSLALALVGGSKILVLDEPSSGLDTEARRFMWNLLKRIRQDRTILITTHDMEEADALGDRIIIMHNGGIMCSGSPLYLKTVLGTGYLLTMSFDESFKYQEVYDLVMEYMPRATVKSIIGTEIIFELRDDPEMRGNLSRFFKVLEKRQSYYGIETFGMSLSTMDEVFHKIGEVADTTEEQEEASSTGDSSDMDRLIFERASKLNRKTGGSLYAARLYALFVKRFHYARRSLAILLFNLSLPVLIIGLSLSLEKSTKHTEVSRGVIDLNLYQGTYITAKSDSAGKSRQFVTGLRDIVKKYGINFQNLEDIPKASKMSLQTYFEEEMKAQVTKHHLGGIDVRATSNSTLSFRIYLNPTAFSAPPVMINLIARAKHKVFDDAENPSTVLFESRSKSQDAGPGLLAQLASVFIFPLAVSFTAASYVSFPTFERMSKAKLIQVMTGLSKMNLHIGSFIFDLFNHSFVAVSILIVMLLFAPEQYAHDAGHITASLTLLMLFGASSIVLAYIVSLLLDAESSGYVVLTLIYAISGILLGAVMLILEMLKDSGFSGPFDAIYPFANISPIFTMAWGFRKISANSRAREYCSTFENTNNFCEILKNQTSPSKYAKNEMTYCCAETCYNSETGQDRCVYTNPFGWSGNRILIEITCLILTLVVFTLILYFLEHWATRLVMYVGGLPILPRRQFDDSDVNDERRRIKKLLTRGRQDEEALIAFSLYKKFGHTFAVRGISFTVHKQECFGLLGVNGAGKSTTFGMLTGDIIPECGEIWQEFNSLKTDQNGYLQSIGYCPQVNPIIDSLTGREMIYLIGRLRGVPDGDIATLAEEVITLVNIQEKIDKLSGGYSGGNKRRLSIALAMMGQPRLVFLDEPTAGVDPGARRKIWTCLSTIREKYECSMILTSHSMGECEALCSRMGIMVRGEFVCLGSIQHLRSKFGRGYTLTMKLKAGATDDDRYMRSFEKAFYNTFPRANMIDNHETLFVYKLPSDTGKLSYMFDRMEELHQAYDLEDYSLSDTTLEQIFIRFVRKNQRKAAPED